MKIVFAVNKDQIEVDDIIELQEGNTSMRFMRDLLSKFVVDEGGQAVPREQAVKMVGKLSLSEMEDTIKNFTEAFKTLQAAAVNPTTDAA